MERKRDPYWVANHLLSYLPTYLQDLHLHRTHTLKPIYKAKPNMNPVGVNSPTIESDLLQTGFPWIKNIIHVLRLRTFEEKFSQLKEWELWSRFVQRNDDLHQVGGWALIFSSWDLVGILVGWYYVWGFLIKKNLLRKSMIQDGSWWRPKIVSTLGGGGVGGGGRRRRRRRGRGVGGGRRRRRRRGRGVGGLCYIGTGPQQGKVKL